MHEYDNTYFHRALQKYGRENFSLEILENDISPEKLDEREQYWIKYYDSYYTSGKGYNMTKGGKWSTPTQIITPRQGDEIKELILAGEKTFRQIGDIYGVSPSCIHDINVGKTFYDKNTQYPIRPGSTRSELDDVKIQFAFYLLTATNLTCEQIGQVLNISSFTVGDINRGTNSWCPPDYSYPVRKWAQPNTYQNILEPEEIPLIIKDLIFSSLTLKDIAQKYEVAYNTIGDISRGISWKTITHQFICPIRKNGEANKEIYSSIYGIV